MIDSNWLDKFCSSIIEECSRCIDRVGDCVDLVGNKVSDGLDNAMQFVELEEEPDDSLEHLLVQRLWMPLKWFRLGTCCLGVIEHRRWWPFPAGYVITGREQLALVPHQDAVIEVLPLYKRRWFRQLPRRAWVWRGKLYVELREAYDRAERI